MNKYLILFAASILFLFSSVSLPAEANDSLPYYIQWDSVQGAGGYIVEVRIPDRETVFTKQFQSSEKDTELDLPAGKYQFRIMTLNKLLKADNSTNWVDIEILSVTAPVFVKLTPTTLTTGKPVALTLTADRITLTAKAKLVSSTGKEFPLTIEKIKNDTFKLTAPALIARGSYSLILVNTADYTTRKNNLLTVSYPDFTVTATSLLSSIVTVKGKNFSKESTLYLSLTSSPATQKKISLTAKTDTTITAPIPTDLPAGDYTVSLANASDLPAKSIYTFTVSPPPVVVAPPVEPPVVAVSAPVEPPAEVVVSTPEIEPAPTIDPAQTEPTDIPTVKKNRHLIALGGGVKTDLIFGGWEAVYPGIHFSGYGFSDFYITDNLRPKKDLSFDFSIGLRADYARMINDGNGKYVKSEAQNISGLFCPAVTVSIPWIRARLYLAAGCEYISVSAKNIFKTETVHATNIDPAGGLGISIEFPFSDFFALGITNQLLYVQDAKSIIKYTVSGCFSILLPVK